MTYRSCALNIGFFILNMTLIVSFLLLTGGVLPPYRIGARCETVRRGVAAARSARFGFTVSLPNCALPRFHSDFLINFFLTTILLSGCF
ncbi:TPA: hypothetical protein ACTXEM_004343, partial [Klebsiella pneumoniae]